MKISPLSRLALGAVALGAMAYPVASSFAVSSPASEPVVSTTISCPASAAKLATQSEVPSISQVELTKAIADKKVVVIDVNGTDSWKEGHIPTALDFYGTKDLKSVLPADKGALVVAYCGNEHCGAYKAAASAAMELGYTNVQHFSPGIAGWKKSGAPTEKGA